MACLYSQSRIVTELLKRMRTRPDFVNMKDKVSFKGGFSLYSSPIFMYCIIPCPVHTFGRGSDLDVCICLDMYMYKAGSNIMYSNSSTIATVFTVARTVSRLATVYNACSS